MAGVPAVMIAGFAGSVGWSALFFKAGQLFRTARVRSSVCQQFGWGAACNFAAAQWWCSSLFVATRDI